MDISWIWVVYRGGGNTLIWAKMIPFMCTLIRFSTGNLICPFENVYNTQLLSIKAMLFGEYRVIPEYMSESHKTASVMKMYGNGIV